MQVIQQIAQWQAVQTLWQAQGQRIALVPTMGNLHAGHFSLIKQAKQQADKVVVSVFVNPMQFAPTEDFDRYPRTLAQDATALADLGVDILLAPSIDELYPQRQGRLGVSHDEFAVQPPARLTDRLCGLSRPGHFTGVCTIVLKLFNIVQPQVAVFGQKDYQQLAIIQAMTQALNLPIDIVAAPTYRHETGLAMSSRNQYLTTIEQLQATAIYQALQQISTGLQQGKTSAELVNTYTAYLLQQGFQSVDYIAIVHPHTLADIGSLTQQGAVVLIAAQLGKTRLIDNMQVLPVA